MILEKSRFKLGSAIPALLIMAIIFFYSAQEATQSSALSSGIVKKIIEATEQLVKLERSNTEEAFTKELLEILLRKGAHLTEYAILAIAVAYFFFNHGKLSWSLFLYSEGVCILYAMSDEFHQLFVPGRSGSFVDVGIDSFGAAIGALIFLLIISKHN